MKTTIGFLDILEFFYRKPPGKPGDSDYDSAFCKILVEAASAEAASLWKLESTGRLRLVYGTNVEPDDAEDVFLEPGEGISGAAILTQKTIAVSQVGAITQHSTRLDDTIGFQTRSMISAPILYDGRLYGVVNILNYRLKEAFPRHWEDRLSAAGILYAQALALVGRLTSMSSLEKMKTDPTIVGSQSDKTVVVGISPAIQNVLYLSLKAGRTDVPVLIYGETGTGKELTAKRIHEAMITKGRPFLGVNCAALTETLLESELFGHVKGAFSGAASHRKGKFVAASGGTLFLDEIGDMSLSCQAKILRVLQEKKVVPVGSEKEIDCAVRILAATNKNLYEQVEMGNFREDLFYRLCGLEIHLPPLRERPEDIELLARYFLNRACKTGQQTFSSDALTMLKTYSWPGNVRQLEQAVLAGLTLCEDREICSEHFPAWFHHAMKRKLTAGKHGQQAFIVQSRFSEKISMDSQDNLERERYLKALDRTRYTGTGRWNVSAAARDLGIARKTLVYRMKKLRIPDT